MINPLNNGMGAIGGAPANPLGGMSLGAGNGLGGMSVGPNQKATSAQGTSFSNVIGDMIVRGPSQSHAYADNLAARLAAGENVDPHQLALATAKAGLEIQMSTRTISQAVSAVRTLFQMQI